MQKLPFRLALVGAMPGSNGTCAGPVSALAETTCVDCDSALTEAVTSADECSSVLSVAGEVAPDAARAEVSGQFCTCRELEAIIGLLHWVVQMALALRPWLCVLYHDKARPLGTNFSLSPAVWQQLSTYLDAEMRFTSTLPGTSIRSGSKLLSVRHVQINSLADLRLVRATGKRLWARVADPSTGKRKLSVASQRFLLFWKAWCLKPQVFRPLSLPPFTPEVSLAADACASGCHIGIGGWVLIPGQHRVWFAESFQGSQS